MARIGTVTGAGLTMLALTAARHAPPAVAPPAIATAVAPQTIKVGVEKWRAGDYAAAVAIWTPFAAAGDVDALFNMGQAYKLGRGVPADAATARDYYRRAAMKGHLPAQANLGIALFQAGEKPEAIKWLRTAADRGEARAQYVLGIAAFNGDGIPRSQPLGYGYLLRAQASGLPQAVTALGTIAAGLSPADRTAGEAVAASLAAGSGVPAALAATTAPRLLPGTPPARATASLPIITPPAAAARPGSPPVTTAVTAAAGPTRGAMPASAGSTATSTAVPSTTADTSLAPAPRPAPPVPVREPTPAQADARAGQRLPSSPVRRDPPVSSAIATVSIPASRALPGIDSDPLTAKPSRSAPSEVASTAAANNTAASPAVDLPTAKPFRVTPAEVAHAEWPPAKAVAKPSAPLKPFEVAVTEAVKKPDGWRVQLGAFSARRLADAAWNDVKATAAPAKPIFATDGAVTKLQMGPFASRDAARAACTKLTAAGRACFIIQG